MTNIIFRPNVSYDKTRGASVAESGTFNEDPYQYVVNPNDYLNFDNIESDDPLRDTRINATNEHNLSKSNSLSANATLQLNRKLNNEDVTLHSVVHLDMEMMTAISMLNRKPVIIR